VMYFGSKLIIFACSPRRSCVVLSPANGRPEGSGSALPVQRAAGVRTLQMTLYPLRNMV
jgi:hypothetical protein